jgi:hypothetical protein
VAGAEPLRLRKLLTLRFIALPRFSSATLNAPEICFSIHWRPRKCSVTISRSDVIETPAAATAPAKAFSSPN